MRVAATASALRAVGFTPGADRRSAIVPVYRIVPVVNAILALAYVS